MDAIPIINWGKMYENEPDEQFKIAKNVRKRLKQRNGKIENYEAGHLHNIADSMAPGNCQADVLHTPPWGSAQSCENMGGPMFYLSEQYKYIISVENKFYTFGINLLIPRRTKIFVLINHFRLCAAMVSQCQPVSKWLRPKC